MKIDKFTARNWLAHHSIALDFEPLTLICGPNGSGKSSIGDGVSFAILSELRRVRTKGERDMLITDGQTAGAVELTCGGVKIGRNVANGKLTTSTALPMPETATREAVQYLLDTSRFCKATDDDRRMLLMKLPGIEVNLSVESLTAELIKRGHDKQYIDLLPRGGIETWEKTCGEKASEARGAWKAITGEAYGAVKAATWTRAAPEMQMDLTKLPGLHAKKQAVLSTISDRARRAGAAQETDRRAEQLRSQIASMREMLDDSDKLSTALLDLEGEERTAAKAKDEAEAAYNVAVGQQTAPRQHLQCPECTALLEFGANGVLIAAGAPNEASCHADISGLRDAVTKARTAWTAKRDAANTARQAQHLNETRRGRIQEYETELAGIGPSAEAAEGDSAAAEEELKLLDQSIALLEQNARDTAAAKADTERAAAEHTAVAAWTALATAVSPSGVAAEMLANGLKPLTDLLRRCADATGWPQVTIDAGMKVRGGGRLYGLMCESEQWRVDAMMTIAIAILSEMKFALLDRFDVLDLPNRRAGLNWLYRLTNAGAMDSIILMGTLKEPPRMPPGAAVHWLGPVKEAASA